MIGSRRSVLLGLAGTAMVGSALGQAYPTRPVTLVVPFAAGGGSDAVGRVIAAKLSDAIGNRVIVDNKAGAGTNLGNDFVAKAAPDGYTLLLAQVTLGINPTLYPKLNYDVRQFQPVGLIAKSPTVMIVNPTLPAKTLPEFIALAKSKQGALNFASGGNGTSVHLAGELFKRLTGTELVHVPYRGSGPAITDLMGGAVQVIFDTAPSATPHARTGTLRALAVTGQSRFSELPDVPTFGEAGLAGFDVPAWYGIVAPRVTPDAIVTKLNGDLNAILRDPATATRLREMGAEPEPGTPAEFGRFISAEIDKWGQVVTDAKVKPS